MNESMFKGPAVVPFVECPNCNRLLECGVKYCPRCREEIDPAYAIASAVVVHRNTQACSAANSIKGFDSFAFLAIIGSFLIYGFEVYVYGSLVLFNFIVIWALMPLLAILVWFYRFGNFKVGDEEYVKASREMRSSLLLWIAILVVQVLLIAAWWL